jgi:4-hydroxythreonine-4-phosphate dehydrogenase
VTLHDSAERPALPVLVTPGEPAGIGAEIALKAFRAFLDTPVDTGLADGTIPLCLMECPSRLRQLAARLDLDLTIEEVTTPEDVASLPPGTLGVLPVAWAVPPSAGTLDVRNVAAVIAAIRTAAQLAQDGRAAAIVTNPIQKSVLMEAGFEHPGHTEFLGSLSPHLIGAPAMMLACDALRVVPVTVHIALRDVPDALTTGDIIAKGRLLADSLQRHFGIDDPRIAVCGLNPHAGEDGQFGDEDSQIIAPAVAALQQDGINAFGPLSADTLFHAAARDRYDAVLGMYHDQVLIPIKTLDFDGGVNVTLGLDFIRTSPDHGTALDIAGTGTARPDSLIAAIRMAAGMAARIAGRKARTR